MRSSTACWANGSYLPSSSQRKRSSICGSREKRYALQASRRETVSACRYQFTDVWYVCLSVTRPRRHPLQSFVPMLINPARDDPTTILKEVGDFVIHIGTTIQSSGLSQYFPPLRESHSPALCLRRRDEVQERLQLTSSNIVPAPNHLHRR